MERDRNEYPIELRHGLEFRSKIKVRAFLRKKEALIDRDPLTKELKRKLETWDPPKNLTEEILLLTKKLENKWAVRIGFKRVSYIWSGPFVQPYSDYSDSDDPLIIGHDYFRGTEVLKAHRLNSETIGFDIGIFPFYEGSNDCEIRAVRGDSERAGLERGDVITKFDGVEIKTRSDFFRLLKQKFPGDTVRLSIRRNGELLEKQILTKPKYFRARNIVPTDDKLLIEMDLNLVDKGEDAKFLKKSVLSLIDRCLEQRKREGRKPVMIGEPEELSFLYHCKDKTFQNYLRWYDDNIGSDYQKPNGYSFRAIAYGENVLRRHPELYEDTMKEIANRTKIIRSTRGEKVLKGVVGEPVEGEDAVEKGVIAIYKAIHRKPYPSRKTRLKKYNCPTHGVSCPSMGCPYAKKWMKDFNKRMMLFKPLYTTDPAVLPQVIGEGRSHSKRKPTADQQSNTK